LAFTNEKSAYKLVEAYAHLGEAYIKNSCFKQAIEHLTMAHRKSQKTINEEMNSKEYEAHILTLLGKSYF